MVQFSSLALALGLQSVVGQFCRVQLSCSSCLSMNGCAWNQTAAACFEGWELPGCAGDRNCINHPCSCGMAIYSAPVASMPLYAKPMPVAPVAAAPLYVPTYTSTATTFSYPVVSASVVATPIIPAPIPAPVTVLSAPLYTSTRIQTSYPVLPSAPLYYDRVRYPVDNWNGGGGGGLNLGALIGASIIAGGIPSVGGSNGGVVVPPVGGSDGGVIIPPVGGGVGGGVVIPPVGGVGGGVVIPPVGGGVGGGVVVTPGGSRVPPAWGARYIAGTKTPMENWTPPAGVAANILRRDGALNTGGKLNLGGLNLNLDAGLGLGGGRGGGLGLGLDGGLGLGGGKGGGLGLGLGLGGGNPFDDAVADAAIDIVVGGGKGKGKAR